jgi:succinylglutamate desuccinylase
VPDDTLRYLPDGLPAGWLEADDRSLLRELGRPTLIRVPGYGEARPRAVSVLLHGDEPTGFQALLHVLRDRPRLPYDLYAFVGNVRAALAPPGYAVRYLDDQEDLNRIWAPTSTTTPLRRTASEVLDHLRRADVEALVDLHNTSGDNPRYAIVTRPTVANLNLATLFTSHVVHWELSNGALVEAVQEERAAIAVELGRPGQEGGFAAAVAGLRRYLDVPGIEERRTLRPHTLLAGLHRVTVPPDARLRFGGALDGTVDLVVPEDADRHNFVEVAAGHTLGRVRRGAGIPVEVVAPDGHVATDDLLRVDGDRLVLTRAATPVMMTRTVEAVRKDCLVYLAVEETLPPAASSPSMSNPANRSSSVRSNGTSVRNSAYDS